MRVGWLVSLKGDPYQCIRHAAQELGCHSGQVSVWDMSMHNQETADLVLKACKDFDFDITAVWCGWTGPHEWTYPGMYATIGFVPTEWRSQRIQDVLSGAKFARMLEVKDIITHAGYMPDNPYHPDRIGVLHAVKYICKEIAPYGQNFLFETGEMIPNTLLQLIKDIDEPNIGINFDPANMIINARGNSADALRILIPYVRGIHAKDATYPQGFNPKGKEVKIGEGVANFPALIKILKDHNYLGDISIEREIADHVQRDKDVREAKAYLEKLIREIS